MSLDQEYLFGFEPPRAEAPAASVCDWPSCTRAGLHRAPRSRAETPDRYFMFCLDHVRVYNKTWNYFRGMSDAEVEACIRSDTVWNRPSWPMGAGGPAAAYATWIGRRTADGDGLFGAFEDVARGGGARTGFDPSPEGRALRVLDLAPPVSAAEVKARYKTLVKRHHPDANGGDKDAEERFKEIHQAYETLMNGLVS